MGRRCPRPVSDHRDTSRKTRCPPEATAAAAPYVQPVNEPRRTRWAQAPNVFTRGREADGVGVRDGRGGRRAHVAGGHPPTRADARPIPGSDRLHRTRRRARLLRGLRNGRTDGDAVADLVDRPFALLEGADPLPGQAHAGGDVRRPRQRALGPAGRRPRVQRERVRRRRARRHGCHRRPSVQRWWRCRPARCGRRSLPPITPTGSTRSCTSGPR